LHKTIWPGVESWELAAQGTRRLQAAVDFIKQKYADQLGELAMTS
jgi:hypothetical protein